MTPESLAAKNLARGRFDVLKVLGNGELKKKLKISAHRFSASAEEKIEKAGGEMVLLPGRTPVEDKKRAKRQGCRKRPRLSSGTCTSSSARRAMPDRSGAHLASASIASAQGCPALLADQDGTSHVGKASRRLADS